jgi:hypothetical protein
VEYSSEEQWRRLSVVRKAMRQCSKRERKCDPVDNCVCLQKRRNKEIGRSGHGCAQNGGGEVVAGERTGAPWRAHERTPGKAIAAAGVGGGRVGRGKARAERRRGRAEARGAVLTAEQRGQGEAEQSRRSGKKKRGKGGPGTRLQNSKITGTLW